MKKIALIIIFILLNTVNCFAQNNTFTENYTREELKEGQQKLYDARALWNELELQYVGVIKNGLAVGAPELTEGEQVAVIEAAGIKNITFRTVQTPYRRHISSSVDYIVRMQPYRPIDIKYRISMRKEMINQENIDITRYKNITLKMKQEPYGKDGFIMMPLKESIDIASGYYEFIKKEYSNISRETYKRIVRTDFKEFENYQNNTERAVFTKDEQKATVTFDGNTITFYEGEKYVFVNGVKKTLYCPPDIKQNEVFLYIGDFDVIFDFFISETKDKKRAYYSFKMEQGSVKIKENKNKENKETIRISVNTETVEDTENRGTIFFYKGGGYEYPIDVYDKNNHMMIAIKDIKDFIDKLGLDIKSEMKCNNDTATLRLWDSMDKTVVITNDSNKILVNGKEVEMKEAAKIENDKIEITIETLLEILEIPQNDIKWLDSKTVKIAC